MSKLKESSYLFGSNSIFIEELFLQYQRDHNSVDPSWQEFFSQFNGEADLINKVAHGPSWRQHGKRIIGAIDEAVDPKKEVVANKEEPAGNIKAAKLVAVMDLVAAFRQHGHILVKTDPLGINNTSYHAELDPAKYSIEEVDMDEQINMAGELGLGQVKVRHVIERLHQIYSSRIGVEFFYIEDYEERIWLQNRFEETLQDLSLPQEDRMQVLQDLIEAEGFETYLHTKFPGTKRFSVEGAEASIAAMQFLIRESVQHGVEEFILGMAHRGRLNTLTKIMGKPYHAMFSEFKGELAYPDNIDIPGDVKYHLGYSNNVKVAGKDVHLSLTPNPSHLEVVNSIVLGKVRAKQDLRGDAERSRVTSILIHGDSAVIGQGSVAESLYLSQLKAYKTGGSLHIVINNQVGFTTLPKDARSTRYCTDIAKAINAPVLHVNGDDADAVVYAARLAAEYRAKFKKDIFIDLVCYRKYGHNEGDEPLFTQPIMYNKIKNHESPSRIYSKNLIAEGVINEDQYQQRKASFKELMDKEFELSQKYKPTAADWLGGNWGGFEKADAARLEAALGYDKAKLQAMAGPLTTVPEGFNLNSKVERLLKSRAEAIETGENIDWGTGETLAYATLIAEGYGIRLTGQDAKRGTFSHRHGVIFDQENEVEFTPCNQISNDKQAKLEIHNSNLSEFAVLSFEYGYSFTDPKKLVIWEAQFGDFANTAQVVIDQYISSAEPKWLRMSGLVMLLPHGYEGQGPEHSSARLERFLQLCAKDNMQVANCTTPASFFHILRRQMHRNFRKPLVVMSPKSLLRHKLAVSSIDEFAAGTKFRPVIGEVDAKIAAAGKKVRRAIICSGKVYYDLLEARTEGKIDDIAIIRMEQIYPFASKDLGIELAKYPKAEIVWCQEEHRNMGAYFFVEPRIEQVLAEIKHESRRCRYVGRDESPSPAVGYMKLHMLELKRMLEEALG